MQLTWIQHHVKAYSVTLGLGLTVALVTLLGAYPPHGPGLGPGLQPGAQAQVGCLQTWVCRWGAKVALALLSVSSEL